MKYLIETSDNLTPASMDFNSVQDKVALVAAFKQAKLAEEVTEVEHATCQGVELLAVSVKDNKAIEGLFKMYAVKEQL